MSGNITNGQHIEDADLNQIWKQVCNGVSKTKTVVKIMRKTMVPAAKVAMRCIGKSRATSLALLKAGPQMLKWAGRANKFMLLPAYVAIEAFEFGVAITKDAKNDSTRNTAEKGANFTGSLAGGTAGFSAGAVIGTLICPIFGTIIGGVAGSLACSIGAGAATNAFVKAKFDSYGYGIAVRMCRGCNIGMKFRTYLKEAVTEYCLECQRPMLYATLGSCMLKVQYLRQDGADTNSINDESKWFRFYWSAIRLLVGEKAMVALVRKVNDEDFHFPNQSQCEYAQMRRDDATYYLAAAKKWSENDLFALINIMRSDLTSLWFLLPEGEGSNVDGAMLAAFFNVMNNFLTGRERINGLQIIGQIFDLYGLLWLNTTRDEMEGILPRLEVICDLDDFHWIVGDVDF